MAITTGLTNSIKQVAADAVAPSGSTLKIALIKVGAAGTYDKTYGSAYVVGLGGDEVPTGAGYTQGGLALGTRSAGPTDPYGWVDYADPVWTAVGALAAIGAVIYDSSQANRVVGFIDFGGTKTATDAAFTVNLPGDGGPGMLRFG
jgi:hypothetical protein